MAEQRTDGTYPGPTYRITLIDDNVDAIDALQSILQQMGHLVSKAYDGATGVALVRDLHPQIVVCDIVMPDIDGYTVITRLRENMQGAMPLLIALTGYRRETDRNHALEVGFDDHLAKPIDAAALLKLIVSHEARGRIPRG